MARQLILKTDLYIVKYDSWKTPEREAVEDDDLEQWLQDKITEIQDFDGNDIEWAEVEDDQYLQMLRMMMAGGVDPLSVSKSSERRREKRRLRHS